MAIGTNYGITKYTRSMLYERLNMGNRELRTHTKEPYADDIIRVHFAGYIHCASHSEIDYHRNPGFEICLIPTGKGLFRIDEDVFPVGNDQVFLTKAPQRHGGWPSPDSPFRILYLCVSILGGNACSDPVWADLNQRLDSVLHPVCRDEGDLRDVLQRLLSEAANPGLHARELIRSLVFQLLLLTVRDFEEARAGDTIKKHPPTLSTSVIRHIDAHLGQPLSLDAIASSLHYSISTMSRRFRAETGFSVMEYCHIARLETAKNWLSENPETVSEIADALCFNSIHHFSNAFRAAYGLSPTQYRKQAVRNRFQAPI